MRVGRQNFLRMMFGYPTEPYEIDPILVKALDKLLILHADHEQNCSTSTVRMIASAGANMFVSVAGGINALSGPPSTLFLTLSMNSVASPPSSWTRSRTRSTASA